MKAPTKNQIIIDKTIEEKLPSTLERFGGNPEKNTLIKTTRTVPG